MDSTKVIHVHLLEPAPGMEQDYYFGSVAAIYDVLPEQVVGVKYTSLANSFARLGYRYENAKCVIKRGTIVRKKWSKKN